MIDLPLSVTPLEMLSLAHTRRLDRDLAMRLATQSAAQANEPTKPAPSQPMARSGSNQNEGMK
jgi:hypothetical protein